MKVCIAFLLFISTQVFSQEAVRIDSPNKYEIIKQKKLTKIYQISTDGKIKKEIFNKIIRDSVQWIYSEKNSSTTIIVTRPMIACAGSQSLLEKSRRSS